VAIDWNDNSKRRAFRLALQRVYFSEAELRIFVDEELNENLAVIAATGNLQATAHGLLSWARSKGRLDQVFEVFCRENPNDPVIAELQQQPLITKSFKLTKEDWETLFGFFSLDDFADIQRAFLRGFKQALGADFRKVRPDAPSLNEQTQIQKLLVAYDDPKLAVRFVEQIIAELQHSDDSDNRDLTALKQWRDRIAQAHGISLEKPAPIALNVRHGYLLVALKESGRRTQKDGAFVRVFVELHVTGESSPIEFDATSVTCSLKDVAEHLSTLIRNAEVALIPYECGEVTLELFLPCTHLEENVAEWEVKNEQDRPRLLGRHRGFLVRSLERAIDPTKRATLQQKWQLLQSCVKARTVCKQFHCQTACPSPGDLSGLLDNKPGLRLLAKLPDDREQRIDIFYDIINAAVPIALWSIGLDDCTVAELEAQVNHLLVESHLVNFADLAQTWRIKRIEPDNRVIKNIRLLCDCPDRWPNLPDLTQEDDLLFAS
jgi:hypothetical protein